MLSRVRMTMCYGSERGKMDIQEDEEQGTVKIGETVIDGFIDKENLCEKCGGFSVFYAIYDAYFCPSCNDWLESKCGDPSCLYCSNRSDKPLPTY